MSDTSVCVNEVPTNSWEIVVKKHICIYIYIHIPKPNVLFYKIQFNAYTLLIITYEVECTKI